MLYSELILIGENVEMLVVKLKSKTFNIFIMLYYLQNDDHGNQICDYIKIVTSSYMEKNDQLLLLGDFNLSEVEWNISDDITPISMNENDCLTLDTLSNYGLQQINSIPNRRGLFLDLVSITD